MKDHKNEFCVLKRIKKKMTPLWFRLSGLNDPEPVHKVEGRQ